MITKTITAGILFLLSIGTGFWLSHSGKPLNTVIFTLHKLIALAAAVFTVILLLGLLKGVEIKAGIWTLIIVSGLFVLGLFVTGGLLSVGQAPYHVLKIIHTIATFGSGITVAFTVYRLVAGN